MSTKTLSCAMSTPTKSSDFAPARALISIGSSKTAIRRAPSVNGDRSSLPYVSVVIPTRNRLAKLQRTVADLVGQTYPADRYEILVIDDGSTDSTSWVMAEHPSVKLFRQDHACANVARNFGISVSRGELVCFTDDDIAIPPSWLLTLVQAWAVHPDAAAIGGPVYVRLEGHAPLACMAHQPALDDLRYDLGDELHTVYAPYEALWGGNLAINVRCLDDVGWFNPNITGGGDEVEWETRAQVAGYPLVYAPDAGVEQRFEAGDLRLSRLLRARYRRGQSTRAYMDAIGECISPRMEVLNAIRACAHAGLRRCPLALAHASAHVGRAVAAVRPSRSPLGQRQGSSESVTDLRSLDHAG